MKLQQTLIVGLAALIMPTGNATPPDLATPIPASEKPSKISPWDKDDGEWITISGKITTAGVNKFTLDYGKGAIVVEMDDYDPQLEGFNLKVNDQVIVTGRVDADADQKRSIEAASVYVKNVNKSFFASPNDEEEVIAKLQQVTTEGTGITLTGKIILIAEKLMTLDTGYQVFEVNTGLLAEDAFDQEGLLRLKVGDKVSAYGAITNGFIDGRILMAAHVVKR